MSETKKKETQASSSAVAADSKKKVINLQRIYVRDLSFEIPNAPSIFTKNWKPSVDVRINTNSRKIKEDLYESYIRIDITAKNESKVAFVAEVEQAGTFYIANLTQEELSRALVIACPDILFPYAREALDNMLIRGSLPPMHLAQVNFQALYDAKRQEIEKDQAKSVAAKAIKDYNKPGAKKGNGRPPSDED